MAEAIRATAVAMALRASDTSRPAWASCHLRLSSAARAVAWAAWIRGVSENEKFHLAPTEAVVQLPPSLRE